MTDKVQSPEEMLVAFERFWIQNNVGFLARYWHTATEALKRVAADPEGITEFDGEPLGAKYVAAVVDNHLEHHNNAGVLLTYAVFDEFMAVLTRKLGKVREAPIAPNDLRDRGVRRYKKFVHQVCRVGVEDAGIDWQFLQDLSIVRNAIIHANGNKSLLGNPAELEGVVQRRSPDLSFKHESRLIVSNEFVVKSLVVVRHAALTVNRLTAPEKVDED